VISKLYRLCGLIRSEGLPGFNYLFPPIRPAAIVIGAQKAGTTALYRYLARHPGVASSKVKEIDFFNCDARYSLGLDFYHAHFPRRTPRNAGRITLDVTPGYMAGAEKAAQRIHRYNPRIRLIAILRDPVTRAYSAWHHYRNNCRLRPGWFKRWHHRCSGPEAAFAFIPRRHQFGKSFRQDLEDEMQVLEAGGIVEMPILRLGLYHEFLSHYQRLFDRRQMLILCSEKMAGDTVSELKKVEAFLGLKPYGWTRDNTRPESVGSYEDPVPEDAGKILRDFYRERNEDLFELLGFRLPWAEGIPRADRLVEPMPQKGIPLQKSCSSRSTSG